MQAGMIRIEFPKNKVVVRQRAGGNEVFDSVRHKWLRLTPEEWVRQHMIQWLLSKNYPSSLMAVEKEIRLGELSKRCDIVVYGRDMAPYLIVECKEMKVPLSEAVLGQVLRYHLALPAAYLIITNGQYCYGFHKANGQFTAIDEFPDCTP